MDEQHVEGLIAEMTRLGRVGAEEQERIVEEFSSRFEGEERSVAGGAEYARRLLEEAVGPERAGQILSGEVPADTSQPTLQSVLETTSPTSLAALMIDEHPQLIALLAGQMRVEGAAELIGRPAGRAPGNCRRPDGRDGEPCPTRARAPRALPAREAANRSIRRRDLTGRRASSGSRRPEPDAPFCRKSRARVPGAAIPCSGTAGQQIPVHDREFAGVGAAQPAAGDPRRGIGNAAPGHEGVGRGAAADHLQQHVRARFQPSAGRTESSGPTQLRDVELALQTILAMARALQESGEIQIRFNDGDSGEEELVV